MPGRQQAKSYSGHSAEGLAEFILGSMAFVTAVPRPVDIGHDFQCVLYAEEGGMLLGGAPFSVQVKSSRRRIKYSKAHALQWLKHQRSPFFICVANLKALRIDLYSTWMLLHAAIDRESSGIDLVPGREDETYTEVKEEGDPARHVVRLGRPILRITAADAVQKERAQELGKVLMRWIELDWRNIHERYTAMFWPLGPREWETNQLLPEEYAGTARFFSHQQNIPRIRKNLQRSAIALRVDLGRVLKDHPQAVKELATEIKVLDMTVRAYAMHHSSEERQILRKFGLGHLTLGRPEDDE